MADLLIYKASAGSGKTFTLVKEYLKIVLQSPTNYRKTLAVTFTNKAANEMKQRIIKALSDLADLNCVSGSTIDSLLPILVQEIGFNELKIRQNAAKVLTSVLHNYSDFAISTIDAFVFKIIRTFSRDLKLPFQFEVELDDRIIAQMTTDIMLQNVGYDAFITSSLIDFAKYKIDTDESWNIERSLKIFAKKLMKEEAFFHIKNNAGANEQSLKAFQKKIFEFINGFENALKDSAIKTLALFEKNAISVESIVGGSKGIHTYFVKLSKKEIKAAVDLKSREKLRENKIWNSTKAAKNEKDAIVRITDELTLHFNFQNDLIDKDFPTYMLYKLLSKTIHEFALSIQMAAFIEEIKEENNLVHISEFNKKIAEIVLNSSVPYIYERIGEKFNHYLIDEFQDTSILQWQNFLPLISNALANNYENLIVGDGKQAIYRFKGGEVEQFMNLPKIYKKPENDEFDDIEHQLIQSCRTENLKENYRSAAEIVNFNNEFFGFLRSKLEGYQPIYDDLNQEIRKKDHAGYIEFRFSELKQEELKEEYLQWVLEIVLIQEASGFHWSDIAILVRANDNGDQIARFLSANNIPVVSSDSLLLSSNIKVKLILSIFKIVLNPKSRIYLTEILYYHHCLNKSQQIENVFDNEFYLQNTLHFDSLIAIIENALNLPEESLNFDSHSFLSVYDITEYLIRLFGFDGEADPYITFLLDLVQSFQSKNGSGLLDFMEFWEEKKADASVKIPEDMNAVKIMSIHKAKGLEFPVVVFPFAHSSNNVRFTQKETWVDLSEDNFETIKSGIVSINKELEQTRFAALYVEEEEKTKLDLMNLLYVVLTRPTSRLYILTTKGNDTDKMRFKLQLFFKEFLCSQKAYNGIDPVFSIGDERLSAREKTDEKPYTFQNFTFVSSDWKDSLQIAPDSTSYWFTTEREKSIEWGKLIHKILSEVKYAEDANAVFEKYFEDSTIDSADLERLISSFNQIIAHLALKDCFSHRAKIKNEVDILTVSGLVYRPDRFVSFDDHAVVIDYKTGSPHESHHFQVDDYVSAISQIESGPIDAYLVYLNDIVSIVKC